MKHKRIDGHYYLKDDGSLVKFKGSRKDPFYVHSDFFYFDYAVVVPNCGSEGLFTTLIALAKSKNRSGSWASLMYKLGKVKRIRVYSDAVELLPDEHFKPLIKNNFYLSNYGRMARLYEHRVKILLPRKNLAGYKQLPPEVVRTANLRTSQVAPNVLELFDTPRPTPECVCLYIDHDPENTHVSNLKWGTRKEASANNGHHDRYCVKVKVIKGCRTKVLDPYIGQTFDSISELARVSGTSPMNIRQYMKNGKVVKV